VKGRVLIVLDRAQEAIPLLEGALKANADDPAIKFDLGRAYMPSGRYSDAIAMFDEVLRAMPYSAAAASEKAQACYRNAQQLQSSEGFEAALSQARRTLKLDPGNNSMLDLIRDALRALGREEDALREMEVELARNPQSPRAWYLKGSILLDSGDFVGAAGALEKAVEFDRGNADAHAAHANALRLMGHYDQAREACENALQCQPLTAYALGWAGIYFGEVGDFSRACAVLEQGVKEFSNEGWLWGSLGWVLQYRDDQSAEESIKAYRKAIDIDNRDIWYEKGIADGLYLAGRVGEANERFAKLLTDWPNVNDVSVKYIHGWSNYRLGQYKAAAEMLKTTADTSEYFLFAQFDYGLTLLVDGHDGAWAAYERAVAQTESLHALRQRGLFYVAIFDLLEAVRNRRIKEASSRKPTDEARRLIGQTANLVDHLKHRIERVGLDTSALLWMRNPFLEVSRPA